MYLEDGNEIISEVVFDHARLYVYQPIRDSVEQFDLISHKLEILVLSASTKSKDQSHYHAY